MWCVKNGIKVASFCDNNKDKVGTFLKGIEIIASEKLSKNIPGTFILISCDAHAIIREQLGQMGFDTENQVAFFDKLWVSNFDFKQFVEKHLQEYENAYSILEDQKSQAVFIGMLNYKLSLNQDYIVPYVDRHEDMYFDMELIMPQKFSSFIDIGAYIGDTLEDYIKKYGEPCSRYICYEPNPDNLRQLKCIVEKLGIENVDILGKGISDERKLCKFNMDSGIATQIQDNGSEIIECTTIDDELMNCEYMKNSMIKMDIEGAEYAALIGAERTIKKYHPVLAVCVYHKPEDMFMIPIYLKKIYPGYNIYLRQYEESVNETVCYAIPSDLVRSI